MSADWEITTANQLLALPTGSILVSDMGDAVKVTIWASETRRFGYLTEDGSERVYHLDDGYDMETYWGRTDWLRLVWTP